MVEALEVWYPTNNLDPEWCCMEGCLQEIVNISLVFKSVFPELLDLDISVTISV